VKRGAGGRPECAGDGGSGVGAELEFAAGLSPALLAYVVGPVALVLLLALRHFGLVAEVPIWA
jgi:hypothetical protein